MKTWPICVYHKNCLDGIAAAWVVWKYFHGEVALVPCGYGDEPPDVTDRDIIIVDFSFSLPVMKRLLSACRSMVWIDHHKSALEGLGELLEHDTFQRLQTMTGVSSSGCGLAWDFYFPNEPLPNPLTFIQDRDLWKFELPYTKQVTAALFNEDLTVDLINYAVDSFKDARSTYSCELLATGRALLQAQGRQVKQLVETNLRYMQVGSHVVPVVNAPYFLASEVGNYLVTRDNPFFAATYHDTAKGRFFSLRSSDRGLDVAEVAKLYGGGGHRNAAGFSRPAGWEGEPTAADNLLNGLRREA